MRTAVRRALYVKGFEDWAPAAASVGVLVCLLVSRPVGLFADEGGVLTFHGDVARTGWNPIERTLTPAAVPMLRKLWTVQVDGDIYAQPLVAPGLAMFGRVRSAVYVMTEQDRIYAFDAADGGRLWGPVALGTPVPRAALSCGTIDPVGITSTPVVDREAGTLYVAGLTTPDGGRTKVYMITALDVKSGTRRPGWPVEIAPPAVAGRRFAAAVQRQGGALTLVGGVIYVPFGGYQGDCGDYHGWVVGVPTAAPKRQEAFATPSGRMGGIPAAGGLAADLRGNLYAATGHSDPGGRTDFGNSLLRLQPSPLRFSGAPRDYFTPSNVAVLNAADTDLGSTAPLVLPDLPGWATPRLLFIAGTQGIAYLVNRDDMGGLSRGTGITREGVYSRCVFGTCDAGGLEVASATAYWDGGTAGRLIFVPGHGRQPAPCGGTGGIAALRLTLLPRTRAVTLTVAWCSPSMRDPGAPAVSSDGAAGGVVWVVDREAGALYALDARTGAALHVLRGADALPNAHQPITPSIWGGRVYVGAGRELAAYGLQ
ncbi:MAG TPA: PQQ-binding-like beta-propeller repeat protein [bacterium]|nr:PQQ-binding-like beta-propeller repeat protein [bacterium]